MVQMMAMYESNRANNMKLLSQIASNTCHFQGIVSAAMKAEREGVQYEATRKRPREDSQSSGSGQDKHVFIPYSSVPLAPHAPSPSGVVPPQQHALPVNFNGPTGKTSYRPAGLICYKCGEPGHYAFECPQKDAQPSNLNASAVNTVYRPAKLTCHLCGQPGHYSSECSLRNPDASAGNTGNRPGTLFCYTCGLPGHYSFQCVQKNAGRGFPPPAKIGKSPVVGRGRLDHVAAEEAQEDPCVILGTTFVNSISDTALFNCSASHSFMPKGFIIKMG
jgi:hypothetical protein